LIYERESMFDYWIYVFFPSLAVLDFNNNPNCPKEQFMCNCQKWIFFLFLDKDKEIWDNQNYPRSMNMNKHKGHILNVHLNPNVSGLKPSATVAILPGSSFGRNPDELTARLAYVDFNGRAALDALKSLPKNQPLSEEFLKTYCGNVIEAIDRICEWMTS